MSRLLGFEKASDGLFVQVRWKGLNNSEYWLKYIYHVFEDVPALFENLQLRESTPTGLAAKDGAQLAI